MGWGRIFTGIALAVALVVGGCAAESLRAGVAKKAKTVGIISAVGDDLGYRNIPFFRWDQEEHHRDVAAWWIDDYVTAELAKVLGTEHEIVPVDYDRGAFQADREAFFNFVTPDQIRTATANNVRGARPDLFVVVFREQIGVGTTGTVAEGLGVLRQPIGEDRYYVHAVYGIAIVDGKTNAMLATLKAVNTAEQTFAFQLLNGAPYDELAAGHWAVENEDVTPAQVEWVRGRVKALFERTLPLTLHRLNMI